ncbi:MAG: ribose-phosphate diphosphokinase, partial [Thermoplasmatales archaeon]
DLDLVLAPDKGELDRVKKASYIIGCDFDYMEKTRIDGTTIKVKPKSLDVHNKNVAIIDDIISTGRTMAKSIQQLKKYGANSISVACTHGLFAEDSIKKLTSAGCKDIISTDTIQSEFSKVKAASCILPLLKSN